MIKLSESPNFLVIKKTGVEHKINFLREDESCETSEIFGNHSQNYDQCIDLRSCETDIVIKYQVGKNDNHILNSYNNGNIYLDSLYFWLLLSELRNSTVYRKSFIRNWLKLLSIKESSKFNNERVFNSTNINDALQSSSSETSCSTATTELSSLSNCGTDVQMHIPFLTVFVVDSLPRFIDKRWCAMLRQSALEVAELDSCMSWLSTLGGACSALGDHSADWADRAAAISARQMVIANRLGDPAVVSRCRLYAAIALIQKREWKTAAAIIRREYQAVKTLPPELQDGRLVKMCLGIWTKLSYEKSTEKLA